MTNNFITLLAKLGIDTDATSKANLEREIAAFSKTLKGLTVGINISPDAIKALEQMANFDFSKMAGNAKTATAQVSKDAIKSAAEVSRAYKEAGEQIGNKDTFSLKHALTGIEHIKAALSKLHPTVKVDFDITDGQKNLNKIKAIFEKDGITTHINFKQVEMGTKDGSMPVWMPVSGQDIDKKMTLAASETKKFDEELNKLRHSGKITNDQFNELQATLKKTTTVGEFEKLNKTLDHMLISNKNATNALKEQQAEQKRIIENEQERKKLVNQIEAAIRSQKTMLDFAGSSALLNNVKGLDVASPDFSTAIKDNKILFDSLKLNAGLYKEQEASQRRIIENETKRRNLITDISSAMRNNKDTMNQEAAKGLLDTVKSMDIAAQDFGTTLGRHQSFYRLLKTNAEDLTREIKDQAKTAKQMITDQNTLLINDTKRAEMVNKIAAAMKAAPQTMDLNSAKGLLHSVENLDIASDSFTARLKQSEVVFNQLKRDSDSLNKTLQTQESIQKTILENENKRKKLVDDINAAMKASANTMDQAAARTLLTNVQNMNVAATDFGTTLGAHNVQFNALKLNAADVARTIKAQTDALKAQEAEQKRIEENDIKRKNLMIAIERSMLAQQRTIDRGGALSLREDVKNMNTSDKDFSTQLKENQMRLNQIKADATVASRANIGIIESFKIAMQKFPVWMAATTIFYSSIRTAREFMNIIIDIDTKMTSLAKVMSEDTDFEKIFDSATSSAERFGQSISQVLDTYVEFARQGFKGDDLAILSDAGLIAANVGEITAQKASEYMTAAIIQWKMEVEDGINIVDSWNNISNNFATTLDKLAQGHMRAGAAAKAMNLTFDQTNGIIGALTAATKQSGNEIGNFLKTALPRLVGNPGQDALASVGVSLTDEAGNIRDVIEVYTDVANKVKELSEVEKIAVTEGLAGKYHITRMQILLDDLGSVDSMYRQIYETSSDSVGSASRENEKYMESLQARINLARVEVEKLALAMGESFLTEGMIQSLQGFSVVMSSITGLSGKIGALPIVLATVGIAVTLLSTKFKGLVGTMALTASSSIINNTRFAILSTTLTALNSKISKLHIAFRSLLAATGVGIALIAVGVGIEYVLRNLGKTRELNEKIAQDNRELSNSYTTNKQSVNSLVKQYKELEEAMKDANPDLETQKEYYDVQNELGSLMPSLVAYEDSYGNSILISSSLIESKIKLLQSQLKIEEQLAKIEEDRESKEKTEKAIDNSKDYKKLAEDTLWNFNWKANSQVFVNSPLNYDKEITSLEEMYATIEWFENQHMERMNKGYKSQAFKNMADDLRERLADYEYYTAQMNAQDNYLAQESIKNAQTIISSNEAISDSAKELATNMLGDLTKAASNDNELKLFADMFDNEELNDSLNVASSKIERFVKSTDTNFAKNKAVLDEYAESLKTAFLGGLKDSEGVSLDKTSDEYVNAEKALDAYFNKLILAEIAVREYATANKMSVEEARAAMAAHNETGESLSEELREYIASLKELGSAVEQVAGVSEKFVSDSKDLIYTYENLASMTRYTAEQDNELAAAKEKLAALYPHLVHEGELRIENIKAEIEAHDVLLKAVEASKEDLLTEEEKATVDQLNETNARIRMINKNIDAIDDLIAAYAPLTNLAKINFDLAVESGDEQAIDDAAKDLMRYSSVLEFAKSSQAELATLEEARAGYVDTLSSALEKLEEKENKEKSNKTTQESIYITDKYKQALEALNLEIEKQQRLRSNMVEHSQEYRNSLQAEIALEKEKKRIMEEQAASLKSQIDSGKIQQTGNISSTSDATSSAKLSGWSGKINSGYGYRTHPITGDYGLHGGNDISGSKGTRLDANVSGKVIASGDAVKNKYHESYGNIVVIQDEDGIKHLYAHLEKAIAQLGDTIVAGMQIGTIGDTGRADGSHLHYETRDASNKSFDSSNYINAAKNGTIKPIPLTITTEQEAIDKAKSDLLQIQSEILKIDQNIDTMQLGVINSQLGEFNAKRETYQRILDYEAEKIETLDVTSERYGATIDRNIKYMEKTQDVNKAQLVYLNELISSGTLSANVLEIMKISAEELTIAMLALGNTINNTQLDKINGVMTKFDEEIDDIQYLIERSQNISSLMDEGTADYNTEIEYQIGLLKQNQTAIMNKRNELKKLLQTEELSVEQVKDYKEQLEDLSLEYWRLEGTIKSTEKALKDSNDKMATEMADKLINAYKDYLSQKRDAHIRSLDAEMTAEDRRHKRVMDNYRDEMDAYRRLIQNKMDSIDREDSEIDYNKEMDELEKNRLEVLRKINLLTLDKSMEAKAERKDLNEELAKIDDDIATKQRKKTVEERKYGLNQLLDAKELEIQERERMENEAHENEKARIDDLKQYWDQFYTDQLNDERKFAKIKADIVAGNFDELSAEFQEYMKEMQDTMPEIENTLDGTMKAVGTSIRQNLIDNIKEALRLLKQFEAGTVGGSSSYSGNSFANNTGGSSSSSSSSSTSTSSLKNADAQVLAGKFLTEKVRLEAEDASHKAKIQAKGHSLAEIGRAAGSTIKSSTSLDAALSQLSNNQKREFGQYLVSSGVNTVSTPELQDFILKYGEKLASLSTGGYTGQFNGGKVGILHEEEVVLNKKETKDFFKYASVLETLNRLINPLKMSSIKQPELATNSVAPSISMEFHVEKMIANESTAKNLAQTVLSEVQNTLKRERGIR